MNEQRLAPLQLQLSALSMLTTVSVIQEQPESGTKDIYYYLVSWIYAKSLSV
jgi:hypothetical protein